MNQGDYLAPHYHPRDEFRVHALQHDTNPYRALAGSARFQDVGKGRKGTVLVRPDALRGTPIVRTTTRYDVPAQCFREIHERLARRIQRLAGLPGPLNNALIERYTNAYVKMGAHSDQALDLVEGSHIAVYSCYRDPELADPPRTLVIRAKDGGDPFEVPLLHDTVVVFSLDTNRRFEHKIVLDKRPGQTANEWLGITFRTSGTFVRTDGTEAVFEDGTPLALADESERQAFYQLRRRENREPDFA
ncbi:MAG: alpha-ketoglutarate-dependent dioxygenase AlkB, partial [Myxococcota bacterium]